MNKQENFVWNAIFNGAMKAGVSERSAKNHAVMGLDDWRKSRFNPQHTKKRKCGVSDLIDQRIEMAKKESA